MDPAPSALLHGFMNPVHAHLAVVVATHGKHWCDQREPGHQMTQRAYLGAMIHQVASEEHHMRIGASHGVDHLSAESDGTAAPEVNVADIGQPARIEPSRQPLVANVQGVVQPNDQRPHGA